MPRPNAQPPALSPELLFALTLFARGQGRHLYGNFSPEVLADYLQFHAAQATLAFVREDGQVTGLGIAWQMHPGEIVRRHQHARPMFDWTPSETNARGLFIANIIATTVPARRGLLAGLFRRFPQWADLQIYTQRKDARRLRRVAPLVLARLYAGHETIKEKEKVYGC